MDSLAYPSIFAQLSQYCNIPRQGFLTGGVAGWFAPLGSLRYLAARAPDSHKATRSLPPTLSTWVLEFPLLLL